MLLEVLEDAAEDEAVLLEMLDNVEDDVLVLLEALKEDTPESKKINNNNLKV